MNVIRKTLYVFISLLVLWGCSENLDLSKRYVFRTDTAMSYLEKHPETYSEYVECLLKVPVSDISHTTVGQLLLARGRYTVFAPTNEAIHAYLQSLIAEGLLTEPTWSSFKSDVKRDSIRRVIVHNSIINSGDVDEAYSTYDFPQKTGEEFTLANMNDLKLTVTYVRSAPDSLYINKDCAVNGRNRNIEVSNGLVHQMEKVIAPSEATAADYLSAIIDRQEEGYLVMARAIEACGLFDTLRVCRDEVYEMMYKRGQIENLQGMTNHGFREGNIAYAPEHRKIGFTIFAERDEFWREQGLEPTDPDLLPKLQQWIADNGLRSEGDGSRIDTKWTDEGNLLNQWVTYHILPMRIPANKLVFHQNEYGFNLNMSERLTVPVYEIYTSFGRRRLLKIYQSAESHGIYLNRFPVLDNGRYATNHEVDCAPSCVGCRVGSDDDNAVLADIVNACIYPIDAPLAYSDEVRNNFARQRIRFDALTLFPEALSNDMRKKASLDERYQHVYISQRQVYPYFENLWVDDNTHFVYYNAFREMWPNLNADEVKAVGRYDITLRLPPVPRNGTYEVRYGYIANDRRGVVQIYFGKDRENLQVTDIPLDLTLSLLEPGTGFAQDTDNEDYDAEVDKRMRNNGYMKGGKSYARSGDINMSGRYVDAGFSPMRRIIKRTTLDPRETYYLRLKSVLPGEAREFMLDYLEYCPKEVYDNPETPEDVW